MLLEIPRGEIAGMILHDILWPVFAMVVLIFVVWFTLFIHRIRHMMPD